MATKTTTTSDELRPMPVEAAVKALKVRLTAFAVCQIGEGWRPNTGALKSAPLHFVFDGQGFLEI